MTFDLPALARRMIAIDTSSVRSNLELLELLMPLCRRAGLQTSLQEEACDGVRQFNLLASRLPVDRETLLLVTHSDTVPPGDHVRWSATHGDPFALTEKDGVLYGLGVADVKLDLLCKLAALDSLRDVALRDNVALAATYGEETGRYGAKLLVREFQAQPGGAIPRRVLVGEPTRLRPGTAHKGYVEIHAMAYDPSPIPVPAMPLWRLTFAGVGAHSSQPHRGASANCACLDWLAAMDPTEHGGAVVSVEGGDVANRVATCCEAVVAAAEPPLPEELIRAEAAVAGISCSVARVDQAPSDVWSPSLTRQLLTVHAFTREVEGNLRAHKAPGFDPPYSTVNNGLVRMLPQRLTHIVDIRRVPGEEPRLLLDAHVAALRAAGLQTDTLLESGPFKAAEGSQTLAALEAELGARGLPIEPELKSGTTEAPVYQQAGMDTVVFGPGQAAGNIHRPNEHVPLADLYQCVEIYRGLILRLCGS